MLHTTKIGHKQGHEQSTNFTIHYANVHDIRMAYTPTHACNHNLYICCQSFNNTALYVHNFQALYTAADIQHPHHCCSCVLDKVTNTRCTDLQHARIFLCIKILQWYKTCQTLQDKLVLEPTGKAHGRQSGILRSLDLQEL